MNRKICVITGTRAEYGLLQWVMKGIANDPDLSLQIIATGMHLSPEFGLTYKAIEEDGFYIDRKVEMLTSSDTGIGTAKSMGLGMIGFADALDELSPDLILVLGDRFEILSAVSSAMALRIPIAHLHGGEASEGATDEAIRHAITKMSHLHFVAAEDYLQRVIQLGEQPDNVYLVGGLGVDSINNLELMDQTELEESLNFLLGKKNLLITFHPTTLEETGAEKQMEELLKSLELLEDTHLIFTLSNADSKGRKLSKMIEEFVANRTYANAYKSLGQIRYLSCMNLVDGVIGNSSSGLLEAPTFKKGTINIGDRQRGRLQARSVINCDPSRESITTALTKLYSREFQDDLSKTISPYGNGGASESIISTIKSVTLNDKLKKKFYDINNS